MQVSIFFIAKHNLAELHSGGALPATPQSLFSTWQMTSASSSSISFPSSSYFTTHTFYHQHLPPTTIMAPSKPDSAKQLTTADLDLQQAPPESQLPDTPEPHSKEHNPTATKSKSVKTNLTVADLDLQEAPPESQLPDTPEPYSKGHDSTSTTAPAKSKL